MRKIFRTEICAGGDGRDDFATQWGPTGSAAEELEHRFRPVGGRIVPGNPCICSPVRHGRAAMQMGKLCKLCKPW